MAGLPDMSVQNELVFCMTMKGLTFCMPGITVWLPTCPGERWQCQANLSRCRLSRLAVTAGAGGQRCQAQARVCNSGVPLCGAGGVWALQVSLHEVESRGEGQTPAKGSRL